MSADEMTRMLLGFGIPADYVAMVVGDQVAIAEGRGARITDDVERLLHRPATSFQAALTR